MAIAIDHGLNKKGYVVNEAYFHEINRQLDLRRALFTQ